MIKIKFGLEKEYFIAKKGAENIKERIVSAKDAGLELYQCDECGYLAEARGEPSGDIDKAILSLLEKEKKLKREVSKEFELVEIPMIKLPEEKIHNFRREYGKGRSKDRGMYANIKPKKYQTAGLHVHFSNFIEVITISTVKQISIFIGKKNIATPETENKKEAKVMQVTQMDMPYIIRTLDEAFKEEIKEAKRQKGIYEMKAHGFEYRSLPNNIDLDKLATVLFSVVDNI